MNDLIDRQAAIDAIKTWGLIDGLAEGQAVEILADEEKLPSAQRWIPCSERLPESNQCVLVSIKGEVDVDWIAVDSTGYGCWYRCMKDVMSADAWMPLPEPYKGKQE